MQSVKFSSLKKRLAKINMPTGGALHCQVEHHVRDKKNLFSLSCITKMGQNFINVFS
jgi:hypothetical protein